ncbi:MAG: hypothetical protein GDA35_03180 [Hyphomonadaceae bacterium]|nr:hypothetical protein [Hyphomonadaceae bacterium]
MGKRYTLYIDAFSPGTIPMARLAQYMQNFAALLGHESAVRLQGLESGSTRIVTAVDLEYVPKVDRRLDNATGFVYEGEDESARIIPFPGASGAKPMTCGPFHQEDTLDGILISVSGASETVRLQLQNGDITYTGIQTHREMARDIAGHMYEPMRIYGVGKWMRDEAGKWILKTFRVDSYEVLEADDLKDVIHDMRAVEGSAWKAMVDPLSTLRALREKDNGLH